MADEQDVLYRIGVEDHPDSFAALDRLADHVEDVSERIADYVEDIGAAARAAVTSANIPNASSAAASAPNAAGAAAAAGGGGRGGFVPGTSPAVTAPRPSSPASPPGSMPPLGSGPDTGSTPGAMPTPRSVRVDVGPARQAALNELQAASEKMEESWIGAARSISGAVRGVAMIAASQSEDMAKAVNTLLVVQGTVDAVLGSVEGVQKVGKAVKDYGSFRRQAVSVAAAAAAAIPSAGSVAGGAGASASGIGGMAVGGGAATLFGAALAAAAGATVGFVSVLKTSTAIAENGLGGGAVVGGWVDSIATAEVKVWDWIGDMTGAWSVVNNEILEEAEVRRKGTQMELQLQRDRERMAREMDIQRRSEESAIDAGANAFNDVSMSPGEKLKQMQMQDEKNSNRASSLRDRLGSDPELGMNNGLLDIHESLQSIEAERMSSQKEMLTLAKQIADEQIRGANESIKASQEQLEIKRKEAQAIEESLLSAKERFAQMSELDQKKAFAAQEKVNASGAESLSDAERAILRRVGTEDANKAARRADVAEADSKGFNQLFGGAEQRKFAGNQLEQVKIQAEIADKREFIARIEQDTDAIAEKLASEVRKIYAEQNQLLEERFLQKLRNDNLSQAAAADAAAAARRTMADS